MNATERTMHTPGPWAFIEGDAERQAMSEIFKANDKEFQIGYVTCESRNPQQRAEDIANARLIASAPALLAACKAALAYLDVLAATIGDEPLSADSCRAISGGCRQQADQLRAAIDAAEGSDVT